MESALTLAITHTNSITHQLIHSIGPLSLPLPLSLTFSFSLYHPLSLSHSLCPTSLSLSLSLTLPLILHSLSLSLSVVDTWSRCNMIHLNPILSIFFFRLKQRSETSRLTRAASSTSGLFFCESIFYPFWNKNIFFCNWWMTMN